MPASLFFGEIRQQAPHLGFTRDNTLKQRTAYCLENPNDYALMGFNMRELRPKNTENFFSEFPHNEERSVFIYTAWTRSANVFSWTYAR